MMLENVDIVSLILLTAGGPAVLLGFYKVAKQGVALLPWLVLLLVGVWGMSYGWEHIGDPVQSAVSEEITDRLDGLDVKGHLQELCRKI